MRATAALVVLVFLAGCFPHNEKYRTYAKFGEGASLLTGIVMEGVIESGADWDAMQKVPGTNDSGNQSCHTKATALSAIGLVLILGGILGFVATVSTSPDDRAPAPTTTQNATPKVTSSTNIPVLPSQQPAAATPTTEDGSAATPKSAP